MPDLTNFDEEVLRKVLADPIHAKDPEQDARNKDLRAQIRAELERRALFARGGKPTFEQWMKEVDRLLLKKHGIDSGCLPDVDYHAWYDQRVKPEVAAKRAVKNAELY